MNRVLRFLMLAAICPFTRPAQMSSQPPPAAQTQSSRVTAEASPVASAVRFSLERQSKNISAAVDEMPADKFSYRPTPPRSLLAISSCTWQAQISGYARRFREQKRPQWKN